MCSKSIGQVIQWKVPYHFYKGPYFDQNRIKHNRGGLAIGKRKGPYLVIQCEYLMQPWKLGVECLVPLMFQIVVTRELL
jgi:hypothetical protein